MQPLRRQLFAPLGATGCCLLPEPDIPSQPIQGRGAQRLRKLPEERAGSSAAPRLGDRTPRSPASLPCPTICGTRGSLTPPLPAPPRRDTAGPGSRGSGIPAPGSGAAGTGAAASGADAVAERRVLAAAAAPSPAPRPGAAAPLRSPLRALPCGEHGVRCAPRRAPSRGSPVFLGTYRPARRGRDRQRGRRNHVGLRDGYNTIYLEKHYITLRDVTWDS